jgi:integrase
MSTRRPSSTGLPHLRFHDLRPFHASLMLKQGVNPKVVSERLGPYERFDYAGHLRARSPRAMPSRRSRVFVGNLQNYGEESPSNGLGLISTAAKQAAV